MNCPRCGSTNPETAVQCAACGTSLSPDRHTAAGTGADSPTRTGLGGAGGRTLTGSGVSSTSGGGYGFAPGARLLPGTLLGTRYEILAILGEGGMGTVYKAQDRELGRLVALKVIRPEMAARPEVLERFKREILLASQVTHRNVLRIHDLGEAGEIRFISMTYVEGSNLKGLLEQEGPLSLEAGLPLAKQIGDALQAAHDAGIVHRDLKPQNILIDRDRNAYIADFGISRSLAEGGTMTETGTILGTVDYMSPEQARGETPDHRGDIYSFGVILYEMFTGSLPFRASNALSIMMKRLHEDAPTIQKARPGLPAWLSAVVARAMQRDPQDRYPSAGELVRDLERQRASRSWRRFAAPRYLVPAAVVILALLLAWNPLHLTWPPWGASVAPPPRTSLVLLPFQNATGDPRYDWVRTGLPSLIRSELIEAKALRLVGEDRVHEVLASLKVTEDAGPTSATSRRVAALLGAENVLSGRLVRIADKLRLDANLLPTDDTVPSVATNTAAPGGSLVVDGDGDQAIVSMVGELSRRVQDRLGVAPGILDRRRGPTELSTRSVEALSLYGEGLALSQAGNQMEAAKRLETALQKDPQFHVARALLAETYDRLGYSEKAGEEAGRAMVDIGAASPYEAARIRAVRARLSGNTQDALKAYREICDITPNSAEAFFDLATTQEDAGDLEGALNSFQHVITLDAKHSSAYYSLGRVHHKMGRASEALKDFQTALALHTEAGNEEGEATVLNGMGNTYRYLLRQPDEALKNYEAAREIRQRIGDRRGLSTTLRNLAMIERDLGRKDEVLKALQEAISISRDIGDRAGLAEGYSQLGDVYANFGRPEDALQAYQEGLKINRDIDDPASLARNLANVGYINGVLGRYVESFIFLKEALAKRRDIGDKTELVTSLVDIGVVEQVQGRYEEALKYDTEGLALAREIGDKEQILVLSANLSNIHEDQGEYGPALALLEDVHRLALEIQDQTFIATWALYLGSVRRRIGDYAGADTALSSGLAAARQVNNAPLIAEGLTSRLALLLERERSPRAADVTREALAQARAARDPRLLLWARLRAGEVSGSVRDLEDVARTASTAGLDPIVATARLALARAHLAAGRVREAMSEARETESLAAPMRQRDVLFETSLVVLKCLKTQRREAEALNDAKRGLERLEEMRQGLTAGDLQTFLGRSRTVEFKTEASSLFRGADHAAEAGRLEALFHP